MDADTTLFSSREWADEALRIANTGLWTMELNGRTGSRGLMGNGAMLELLGLDSHPAPEECFSYWYSRIDPASVPAVMDCVAKLLSTGRQQEIRYWWTHPRRGRIAVRCGGKLVSSAGEVACIRGYHQDVTEVEDMRCLLREQLLRFETSCRIGQIGVFEYVRGPRGRFSANGMFLEQFGMKDGFSLRGLWRRLAPGSRGRVRELLRRETWQAGRYERFELEWLHPERGPIWFDFKCEFERTGGVVRAVGYTFDITERKEHEIFLRRTAEDAEASKRAQANFFAQMSHELRTPLNTIVGLSYLALKTELTTGQYGYVSRISRSGIEVLGMLNSLMDLSRITADVELEQKPFHLKRELGIMAAAVQREAGGQEVDFQLEIAPDVPLPLTGDAAHLRQALLDVCERMIASAQHGCIVLDVQVVSCTLGRAQLSFSIHDCGNGMSGQELERLFNGFSAEGPCLAEGRGLGFAVSRRLVELMGGVFLTRVCPDGSSVVRIELAFPLAEDPRHNELDALYAGSPAREAGFPCEPLDGMRALVAEDNEINRYMLVDMLSRLGVESRTASNGQQAVEAFERDQDVDVILMDVRMPLMDGYEAAWRIRESRLPGALRIPILAMSAQDLDGEASLYAASGMSAHLKKPVDIHELAKALACWGRKGPRRSRTENG